MKFAMKALSVVLIIGAVSTGHALENLDFSQPATPEQSNALCFDRGADIVSSVRNASVLKLANIHDANWTDLGHPVQQASISTGESFINSLRCLFSDREYAGAELTSAKSFVTVLPLVISSLDSKNAAASAAAFNFMYSVGVNPKGINLFPGMMELLKSKHSSAAVKVMALELSSTAEHSVKEAYGWDNYEKLIFSSLKNKSEEVRAAAVGSLGTLAAYSGRSYDKVLKAVADQDPSDYVRKHARMALKKG